MGRDRPAARLTRSPAAALEALPIGIALTLLAALPAFFNLATRQIFEEEKSLLLRAAALVAVPGTLALWRGGAVRGLLARPIVFLLLALVATLTVSTVLGGAGQDAVFGGHMRRHGLVTWIALAVLFAALVALARSARGRDLIVRAVVIGACWPAAYLLLQWVGVDPVEWIAPNQGHQIGGTFGNHVMIGGYLALVLPLTLLEAWRSHRGWLALALLQAAALVVSGSRGAVVALVAATAAWLGVLWWRMGPRRTFVGIAAPVIAVILVALLPSLRPAAIMKRLDPQTGSARVRILIWHDTLEILRYSGGRLILGHGPERVRGLFPAHYTPEIGRWEQIDTMPDRAHNETLEMLVAGGVVGAVLQLSLFGVMLFGALRLGDVRVQACLVAAVVAHVIEIQFGIATVSSRLAFLALAAIIVGAQLPGEREPDAGVAPVAWVMLAAFAGALSPWLSTLPASVNNPFTSGGEEQFVAYLQGLSIATPMLYLGGLAIAFGLAYSLAATRRPATSAWWQVPALAAAAWLVVPLSIQPSRADSIAAAAAWYEEEQRWPEATIAFGAARQDAPAVAEYEASYARAAIQWAVRSEPERRDQLLRQARTAYERAAALDGADPIHARHLGSYFRIRASSVQGSAREEALLAADRLYAGLSATAPTLTPIWVEWAWVDVDRQRLPEAIQKLDRALALDPQRADALRLREDLVAKHANDAKR